MSSAGGSASTATRTLDSTVGQEATGARATSESFALETGVAWTEPVLGTDHPILHGLTDHLGIKGGGEPVAFFGANLKAPGAGASLVTIAGDFISLPKFPSDNVVGTRTPNGEDAAFDNPIGRAEVVLTNSLGTARATQQFFYGPALTHFSHAQVGRQFELTLLSDPQSFCVLAFSGPDPAIGPFKVPPYGGTMALTGSVEIIKLQQFTASGTEKLSFQIPDDPSFGGSTAEFQALSLKVAPTLSGSFSNVLVVDILP